MIGTYGQGSKMCRVDGIEFPFILLENTSNNGGMFKMVNLVTVM
jgi:hypothetical protein